MRTIKLPKPPAGYTPSLFSPALLRHVMAEPIACQRILAGITGQIAAGLILTAANQHLAHAFNRGEGWFCCSRDDWRQDTGLTDTEFNQGWRRLQELQLIEAHPTPPILGLGGDCHTYTLDASHQFRLMQQYLTGDDSDTLGDDRLSTELFLAVFDDPILCHRAYPSLTGNIAAGLILSHAVAVSERDPNTAQWLYQTTDEWRYGTGLSDTEFVTGWRRLVELGFINEFPTHPCKRFRVNTYTLTVALSTAAFALGNPREQRL